jgi:signal transduction histidine kinase
VVPIDSSLKLCVIFNSIAIIICVAITTVIYMKAKKTRELYSLMVCNITMIFWLFFVMVEKMSVNLSQEFIAMRFTLFPIMFLGAFWLIFSLLYTGVIKPRNQWKVITLILLPQVLCYWPILTEKFRYLIIVRKTFKENTDVWGVTLFISLAFTYVYIFSSIYLLNRKMKEHYGRRVWLFIAILIPIAINILNIFNALDSLEFDVLPLSFSVFCIILSIYIFGYRIIEIVPLASYELFTSLNEAMLIADKNGVILDYNAASAGYFGKLFDISACVNITNFLIKLGGFAEDRPVIDRLAVSAVSTEDVSVEESVRVNGPLNDTRQYNVSVRPLLAANRKVIGKLITFKDVTEYRLQTLENERQRLSDDLHDSLGNCINVISSNLEYVLRNTNDSEEIKECLRISYEKTTGAFLSLRRIVDELRPVDIENNGLLWALESLFRKMRIKDIAIEFTHSGIEDNYLRNGKLGETIYFICQEAVSNSVTHGHAKNITVTLIASGSFLKLYITDDGEGCGEIIRNKGLNSMESRVKALGGEFDYGSPDDGGFNIRTVFPLSGL